MDQIPEIVPSGDSYIDNLRDEIFHSPTTKANFQERWVVMKLWAATLQQLGIELKEYLPIDQALASHKFHAYEYVTDPDPLTFQLIDKGFFILEKSLARQGFNLPGERPEPSQPSTDFDVLSEDWPLYQHDPHHSGYGLEKGPNFGRCLWMFPISLGWRSRPAIDGENIFAASPGMRVSLYNFNKKTGEVIWKCRRQMGVVDDQLYHSPAIASSPQVVGEEIVVREVGSRGNTGWAKHLVIVDKVTGSEKRKLEACHIDYRAGYAAFSTDGKKIVFPTGKQDIEGSPAIASAPDEITCVDYLSGTILWTFFVGPIFGELAISDDAVFLGNLYGEVFCLELEGAWSRNQKERIRWSFKCTQAVNATPLIINQLVVLSSNDGNIYALNEKTGGLIWKWSSHRSNAHTFRLFSNPLFKQDRIYIGSADGYFYCIEASTGKLVWEYQIGEWIRSAAVLSDDTLVVAAMDGTLYGLVERESGVKRSWSKKVSSHPILSDLVESEGLIYFTTSDLYLVCCDSAGLVKWKKSLIESTYVQGVRILTDQLGGGSYFTGKPTAAGGTAFIGSPSGFLYAIDLKTGTEKWRFECGAAISSAPSVYKNKVYFGQQGGEDWYYCLDESTGHLIWKQSLGWVWGSANLAQDRVFVPGIDGFLNCLDASSGAILWRHRTSRSTCSEPAIDGDIVYFGGWDHHVHALNLFTGDLIWKFHVDGACDSGAPIANDGKLYLPSGGSDRFRCLDGSTGRVIWEFHRPQTNFNATPAFDGKHIYLSINQGTGLCGVWVTSTICCLDAVSGKLIWEHEGGGLPAPAVAGDSVYTASSETPFFYCIAREPGPDGKPVLKWKYYLAGRMWESAPAISQGKALVLSDNGYLMALV